jgi:hypothetical protein
MLHTHSRARQLDSLGSQRLPGLTNGLWSRPKGRCGVVSGTSHGIGRMVGRDRLRRILDARSTPTGSIAEVTLFNQNCPHRAVEERDGHGAIVAQGGKLWDDAL